MKYNLCSIKYTNLKCGLNELFFLFIHPHKHQPDQDLEHQTMRLDRLSSAFPKCIPPIASICLFLNFMEMETYGVYYFVSDFFNSALCLWAVPQSENPGFWIIACPIMQITILHLGQLQSLLLKGYSHCFTCLPSMTWWITWHPLLLTASWVTNRKQIKK